MSTGAEDERAETPAEEGPPADHMVLYGAAEGNNISWSQTLGAFISPSRAAVLDPPHSALLLRKYIVVTGPRLAAAWGDDNPLMSRVLPIAYTDDLVMHCLMALGGTVLPSSSERQQQQDEEGLRQGQSDDVAAAGGGVLSTAAEKHYACVLRAVRVALQQQDLRPGDTDKVLRILLVLILMAHYEALASSTCATGGIFPHLRAGRQLISWLRQPAYAPATADARHTLGYLLELYTYLVVVNMVGPRDMVPSRTVIAAPDADDADDGPIFRDLYGSLSGHESFGMLFTGCHSLFELIPPITQFAARRLAEQQQGQRALAPSSPPGNESSSSCRAFYSRTRAFIAAWAQPPPEKPLHPMWAARWVAIGETYRHALHIFLETAMLGSDAPEPDFKETMQTHALALGAAVLDNDVLSSVFATVILWPVMVMGSVLATAELRELLLINMRAEYTTWNSVRGADLLELMWADQNDDPRCYGPYGLYLTMRKHGIDLCIC